MFAYNPLKINSRQTFHYQKILETLFELLKTIIGSPQNILVF